MEFSHFFWQPAFNFRSCGFNLGDEFDVFLEKLIFVAENVFDFEFVFGGGLGAAGEGF